MAFEPIYEVLSADYKKRAAAAQVVAECRLVTDGAVKIAKVLSVHSWASIASLELLTGEARFTGNVGFKVLFVDNEGANHVIEHDAPFADAATDAMFVPGMRAGGEAHILDTDTISVNPTEIRLAAVVEISIEAMMSDKINYLSGTGTDVYTQEEQVEFSSLTAFAEDEWTHETEFDPKINPLKIISCDSAVICERVRTNQDTVRIEGRIFSTISFETEGGLLKSMNFSEPFEQEIAARGAAESHRADAMVSLIGSTAELIHDEKNDKKTIQIVYSLKAGASVFADNEAKAVVDAFSIKNELNIVGESVPIARFDATRNYADRVEGTATLESEMPEIDNILSVCASQLNVTAAYAAEGKVTFEGVVNTAVVYYNAASNTKNSIAVELPFSLSFREEHASNAITLIARGVGGAVGARIKRGNEVELSVEVYFSAAFFENKSVFVIKEIEQGEERKLSKSAIAIYITRGGESLWEVAKALMSTPELIMAQNPSIKLPLEANERVLVYKSLS